MSFKPIEPKRDEFRRYLERCGIIEALSKVFAKFIDSNERPDNPLEYIGEHLGDSLHQFDNIAHFQTELDEARKEVIMLKNLIHDENLKNTDSNIENADPV